MGKVNVVIVDATGNKEQKVGLPDDHRGGIYTAQVTKAYQSKTGYLYRLEFADEMKESQNL